MNVKLMGDLELVQAFKGFGMKMDKTTKIARVAVLTELMNRPLFKKMCDQKGINYNEFLQKANQLSLL